MPGAYNVTVTKFDVAEAPAEDPENEGLMGDDSGAEAKSLIPGKYSVPSTSGLTVEVKAGMEPVTLALTSE